jgi:hypothetical protein
MITAWLKQQAAKIAAVLAATGVALIMWLKLSLHRAQSDRDRHKANAEALEAVRTAEGKIRGAIHEARTEAQTEASRQNDDRAAGRRPDTFGDSRLRK